MLQFTSIIRHLKGVENIPADTMFWTINSFLLDLGTETIEFVEVQLKDEQLQKLLKDNTTWLNFTKIHVLDTNLDIVCDTRTGRIRPFVPESLQCTIYSSLHNMSHSGADASVKLVTASMFGLKWIRIFDCGQKAKIGRHTRTPVDPFSSSDEWIEHVHIDITLPLPPYEGYTYLLICVDHFSRWCKVLPMMDTLHTHTLNFAVRPVSS